MRRTASIALLALAAGLAPSAVRPAAQEEEGLTERVVALEDRVAALERQLAELAEKPTEQPAEPAARKPAVDLTPIEKRLTELADRLEQSLVYLRAQAESAVALEIALRESEENGFTYGINPTSREVLLAGFRQFSATLQKPLPAPPPPVQGATGR